MSAVRADGRSRRDVARNEGLRVDIERDASPSDAEGGVSASQSAAETAFEAFERASQWRMLALALAKASRDCVKLVDLDGRILGMNSAARRLLQLDDPGAAVGRVWETFWGDPERALVRDSVERGKAGLSTSFAGFCPTAKGEPRWWEVEVAPVPDETGVVRCLVAVSRDVTAAHEREQEMQGALKRQRQALLNLSADFEASSRKLRDAEARASQDDKLRLFGRFVGGVVHDFNNVFAAVHGAARLLRRRVSEPQALDVVSHVERAAERGAGLARQLLDFARSDSEATEVFDPAALLSRDAHLLRHIVSGEATLTVEAAPDAWAVLGAPQRFQSVAFNLVANARDAIRPNGRVEVKLENCPSGERPPGLEAGDYVLFRVADDGSGMAPETLRRAGEPFFTTKPAGQGTGLGLASAFELAAACGGRTFVESEVGVGTRVAVYLRRSPLEGERVDAPLEPGLHGGAKILLVDDDPLTRDHLAGVFRALHYVVVEASAYEIAAAQAEVEGGFDLVIADFDLRDGRGDALVAELRAWEPPPPAIYLAGASDAAPPQDETVLMKPVSETRLARAALEKLGRLPGAFASAEALRAIERIAPRIHDDAMKRAMAAWGTHVATHGRIPALEDEGPWGEPPTLSYVVAVGTGVDPELRFERVGSELSARLGRPLVGSTLKPGDEQMLGDVARALRRRLDGTPGYRYTRFALGDGKVSLVERLLLPLGDAEGRVGLLFGLVAFNEASAP
jgi:PAS domain S-box-containing protein